MEYLGHIVYHEGAKVDPKKIKAIKEWKVPTTIKQLKGFLKLTGYYRKFVKNYGRIAAPLTTLLKKCAFHGLLKQLLYGCGDFPFLNGFNFVRFYLNTLVRYNMTQIFHLLYSKETFGCFCI